MNYPTTVCAFDPEFFNPVRDHFEPTLGISLTGSARELESSYVENLHANLLPVVSPIVHAALEDYETTMGGRPTYGHLSIAHLGLQHAVTNWQQSSLLAGGVLYQVLSDREREYVNGDTQLQSSLNLFLMNLATKALIGTRRQSIIRVGVGELVRANDFSIGRDCKILASSGVVVSLALYDHRNFTMQSRREKLRAWSNAPISND